MRIAADVENFRAENFEVLNFYGEDTCFAWQNNLLVVFPYVQSITTPKLPLVAAPHDIKNIRSFGGRVFVICKPSGVYKFMKTQKFCRLSDSGLGIGPAFYHVYSPENNWLYLKDKSAKSDRQLFPLQQTPNNCHKIFDLTLSVTNSAYSLRKALHLLDEGSDENILIIANGKKVFKITQRDVQLIYRCEGDITDIVGITDDESIVGFVIVCANSAVLAYVVKEKLVFDKVYLDSQVTGLCAGASGRSGDAIWLAHTDGSRIYYSSKTISTGVFRRTRTESKRCLTIRHYRSGVLIYLSDNSQLLECRIQTLGLCNMDDEEFLDLNPAMLKGSDRLVDQICQSAKDLRLLNERLLNERDKLKRINIFAHKQTITVLPEVSVERIADQMFLRIKFDSVLPMNCHVVAVLQADKRSVFSMKFVEDRETVVDLPVEKDYLDSLVKLGVDLVTFAEGSHAWCLIRDYTKKPKVQSVSNIGNDRMKFLTSKLTALQNLMAEGNVDMKKLSVMKKSIRRGLQNL